MDGDSAIENKAFTHHVVMGIIGLSFLALASFSELFSIGARSISAFQVYGIYWLSFTGMGLIFMGAAVVTTAYSWESLSAGTKRVVLLSVAVMISMLLFQTAFEFYRFLKA